MNAGQHSAESDVIERAMRSTNLWVSDLQVDAVMAEVERAVVARLAPIQAIIDDHEDCFPGAPIHETYDNECVDDCAGCCADDVMRRLRLALRSTPGQCTDEAAR